MKCSEACDGRDDRRQRQFAADGRGRIRSEDGRGGLSRQVQSPAGVPWRRDGRSRGAGSGRPVGSCADAEARGRYGRAASPRGVFRQRRPSRAAMPVRDGLDQPENRVYPGWERWFRKFSWVASTGPGGPAVRPLAGAVTGGGRLVVRDSEPGAGCAQQAWKGTDSSPLWASGLLEEHPSPLDSGTGTIGAHGTIRLRIRFDATGALGGGIPVQVRDFPCAVQHVIRQSAMFCPRASIQKKLTTRFNT